MTAPTLTDEQAYEMVIAARPEYLRHAMVTNMDQRTAKYAYAAGVESYFARAAKAEAERDALYSLARSVFKAIDIQNAIDAARAKEKDMNTYPCPNCSSIDHVQKLVAEDGMELPIRACNKCGEEWEDADTFRARGEAIATRAKDR